MSKSVADYIKELEKELETLQKTIAETEEAVVQEKVQYELNKNKRNKRVGKKIEDYKAQGMDLSFGVSADDFKVTNDDVKTCLKLMYKID